MNESEFRDWARRALGAMDEKIERYGRERAEPTKPELDKQLQGSVAKLVETLARDVKAGQVAGLAIAYVNDNGMTYTGWAADKGYFALAGATTFIGLELLEEYRKAWRADQEAANVEEKTA